MVIFEVAGSEGEVSFPDDCEHSKALEIFATRIEGAQVMKFVIVGIVDSYVDAEDAVEDLEEAGIKGGQVEVISEIDEDARTADTPGEPATKSGEPQQSWISRLFGAGGALENVRCAMNPGHSLTTSASKNFMLAM